MTEDHTQLAKDISEITGRCWHEVESQCCKGHATCIHCGEFQDNLNYFDPTSWSDFGWLLGWCKKQEEFELKKFMESISNAIPLYDSCLTDNCCDAPDIVDWLIPLDLIDPLTFATAVRDYGKWGV